MNEKAFKDLVEKNASALTAYAYSRCGDMHLAQDAVQESFVKYLKSFNEIKNPKAWLYKTCKNKLIDSFRKNKGEHLGSEVLELMPNMEDLPLDGLERAELHETLFQSMELLKEAESEIINLRYFGDLSYIEIAKVLEISPISAGVRLKRALDSLRKIMRESRAASERNP